MTVQPASKAYDIVQSLLPFYNRTRVLTQMEYKRFLREIESLEDYAERYMLQGMLECHYGDSFKCEEFFSKALNLSKNDIFCHNYIVAMEWLGKYRNAVSFSLDNMNNIFESTTLFNIFMMGNLTFRIDLVQECLSRAKSLLLDINKDSFEPLYLDFFKFKNTSHYNNGDEIGYSELIMDFHEKYPNLIIDAVDSSYDHSDEVFHVLYFLRDLYNDDGNTFLESQEFFIEKVFERELNQRIIVSHISGVTATGAEHGC
ncbi:hypothetical protein [Shewanella baltica]|uniref:hypothetical protein n=1 Tax=Shewanella baltica TaxID=62322 RepID=UPI00014F8D13|nr:hypothetical protein [Shewanella baltica]ABS06882.1 hypothetical protein Shew185_0725 [Shewanella baltica OS185]